MLNIDLLTVVVASIIGLIFGYLWYSPLFFGNVVKKIYSTSRKKSVVISLSFLLLLVVSYFIAFLEIYLKVTSFWDGVVTGILLWIGFILPIQIIDFFLEKKKLVLFFINISFLLILFIILSGILAG